MPNAYLQGVPVARLTHRRGFLAFGLILACGGLLAAPGASQAGCGLFAKAKARRAARQEARAMASACSPQYAQFVGRTTRVQQVNAYGGVQAPYYYSSTTVSSPVYFGASACANGQCPAR